MWKYDALIAITTIGLVDAFAIVKIQGKELHSKIVHQSSNPVWNELLKFHLPADSDVKSSLFFSHSKVISLIYSVFL